MRGNKEPKLKSGDWRNYRSWNRLEILAARRGLWERPVGSSKKSLRTVLEKRSVTDEVLLAVLKEVAWLLNTRPLTHVSTDPSVLEPLTPNHYFLGCQYLPNVEEEFSCFSRRRFRQSQFIVIQYWRRCMQEYGLELIDRKKWNGPKSKWGQTLDRKNRYELEKKWTYPLSPPFILSIFMVLSIQLFSTVPWYCTQPFRQPQRCWHCLLAYLK